nr:DNA-directed DNA polymerase [Tanacetum cinerariifolium]
MVKEGIVLGHKVSEAGLEVDKAKINVISKLPPPLISKNYTITKKELMAVVFALDKFRSYLVLTKTIIHTDHSALRHLFKKQDAKPHLIRWIMLLQEFNIEIKDKKGIENVAANHLSRIDNDDTSDDDEVDDNFPRETLMEIDTRDESWFADFANYLVKEISRKGQNRIKTRQKREAWRSWEMSKAVTVERARKTEENKKRMNENAYTVKKLFKFKRNKKRQGPKVQLHESIKFRGLFCPSPKAVPIRTMHVMKIYELRGLTCIFQKLSK